MADKGTALTDARIAALMRRLESVYNDALQTAIKNNEKAIAKYAALTDDALKNLTPEARRLKREAFAREVKRTESLKNQIADELAAAGKTAARIIQGEMTGIFGLNYDYAAFSIQRQAGLRLDFTAYDRNQLAALVNEEQSPFSKIAYNNLGSDKVIVRRLQDQLIQATLNGEGRGEIIRRIKSVTGQSTRQAKRVAQTERVRVQSQGRNTAIHEAAQMGLDMSKQWLARLVNTRESHQITHLEVVDEGEAFSNGLEYPGDPNGSAANVINCHCVLKPMLKSVSPALAKHREAFGRMSFEDYQAQMLARAGNSGIMNWQGLNYASSYTKKQAVGRLKSEYGIDFRDSRKYPMDAGLLNDCVGWLDAFAAQYGGFMSKQHTQLPLLECVAPSKMKNAVGIYTYYRSGKAVSISLNGLYHADTQAFGRYVDQSKRTGWSVANATLRKTFVHEYGHHVSNAMCGIMSAPDWQATFIKDCIDEFKKQEPSVNGYRDMEPFVGIYAASSESELFAEAFAEYFGGDTPRAFAQILGTKLDALLKGVK